MLPCSKMILAQARNVEHWFVSPVDSRHQPCLFFAFLQDSRDWHTEVRGLLLALRVKSVVRIDTDLFKCQPKRHGFEEAAILEREDLLVVHGHALTPKQLYRAHRLRRHLG